LVISLLGAGLALAATRFLALYPGAAYSGLVRADAFSLFVHLIVIGAAFLTILGSAGYLKREGLDAGEFCALILLATAGMGVMAGAHELLTAFIGLEMSSIASYILAGYRRDAPPSNEAAMKYFLLGSFATAFFLYGIALSFGATGSTHLDMMSPLANDSSHALLKLGLGFIFIGLAFKVAAAPFQLWTPDVYEGAPAPVTAMLSTGPKAAAFALALRILASVDAAAPIWFWALWVAAMLSMFVGNLSALVQTSVKRMLAYSSIAHAGYILVALTAAAATDHMEAGIAAALFYLVSYAMAKLGAFLIVAHLGGAGERHVQIEDFTGLGRRQPAVAACFSLFLLSLLGLPITAGFLGKFYVFNAALESNLIWLAILVALNSVIGAYYYLRVMVAMYMREPKQEITAEPIPWTLSIAMWVTAAGTVYVGLFPTRIIDFAAKAALNIR
jgi:NADH-quinone oxidoreductase subunit N